MRKSKPSKNNTLIRRQMCDLPHFSNMKDINFFFLQLFLGGIIKKVIEKVCNMLPTYVLFVTCYHKDTACYSASLSSCTSQISAGSISASQSISQLYNETPLPLTHRDKDVPFNPKVSASSPRCHLALLSLPPRTSVTPLPSLFPKQRVSDTCNIPVAGVSERNQRQDLSLLTLSVACPLFL